MIEACASAEDRWNPGWGDDPGARCASWASNPTWGGLRNGSSLMEKCSSSWAQRHCEHLCCVAHLMPNLLHLRPSAWWGDSQAEKRDAKRDAERHDHRHDRHDAKRDARRDVVVYNRIGKCGSTSTVAWMKRACFAKEIWPPSPFAPTNNTEHAVQAAVDSLRRDSVHECKVLFGHFQYIPLEGARYMNILCDPVERWTSLYNFYKHSPLHFRRRGGRPVTDLADCTTRPLTRRCLAAPDSHISDYFGSCDARDIWKRYAFLATLDEMKNSTRRLAAFLGTPGADEIDLPHLLHNDNLTRDTLTDPMRIEVSRDLSCDMDLWSLALRDLRWRQASAHHHN